MAQVEDNRTDELFTNLCSTFVDNFFPEDAPSIANVLCLALKRGSPDLYPTVWELAGKILTYSSNLKNKEVWRSFQPVVDFALQFLGGSSKNLALASRELLDSVMSGPLCQEVKAEEKFDRTDIFLPFSSFEDKEIYGDGSSALSAVRTVLDNVEHYLMDDESDDQVGVGVVDVKVNVEATRDSHGIEIDVSPIPRLNPDQLSMSSSPGAAEADKNHIYFSDKPFPVKIQSPVHSVEVHTRADDQASQSHDLSQSVTSLPDYGHVAVMTERFETGSSQKSRKSEDLTSSFQLRVGQIEARPSRGAPKKKGILPDFVDQDAYLLEIFRIFVDRNFEEHNKTLHFYREAMEFHHHATQRIRESSDLISERSASPEFEEWSEKDEIAEQIADKFFRLDAPESIEITSITRNGILEVLDGPHEDVAPDIFWRAIQEVKNKLEEILPVFKESEEYHHLIQEELVEQN
eukprot:412446_1